MFGDYVMAIAVILCDFCITRILNARYELN